jgi:hypothetical protein
MKKIFESFRQYINEEFIGFTQDHINNTVEIYKNPKSIKKFEANTRAIATKSGDIYVIDNGYNILHKDIVEYLDKKTNEKIKYTKTAYLTEHIHLMRYEQTDYFYLSDGYLDMDIEDDLSFFKETLSSVKQKNPKYTFLLYNYYKSKLKDDLNNNNITKI